LKLVYLSDHPLLTTGFGTVSCHLLKELQSRGADLAVMGVLYMVGSDPQDIDSGRLPYPVFCPPYEDPYGIERIGGFIAREKPDVILICNELHLTRTWISKIRQSGSRAPVVVYRGVSCDELYREWREGLKEPDYTVAYTRYAAEVIKKYTGRSYPYVYHGVNRTLFHPYEEERRAALRRLLGWDGRFVVMYVGRNHHTKQQPKLLRVFEILKKMGLRDALCYLHCKPVVEGYFHVSEKDRIPMGNNLVEIAEEIGVQEMIHFSWIRNEIHATPHDRPGAGGSTEPVPERVEDLVLADLYNAADFYVHVSEFETFGLPLVEAMACGLPVAHKNDGGVMNEICGDAGRRLEPVKFDRNILTQRFGELSETNIARTIMDMYDRIRDPKAKQEITGPGLVQAARFSWEDTGAAMEEILSAVVKGRR
jgi:glycosyltransferase involved in cell wall biosynthesis